MSAIGLYARKSAEFDAKVANASKLLCGAAERHAGRIVQATSLGAEDMVITDLIARLQLAVAIGTLETGKLHDETVALIPRVVRFAASMRAGDGCQSGRAWSGTGAG